MPIRVLALHKDSNTQMGRPIVSDHKAMALNAQNSFYVIGLQKLFSYFNSLSIRKVTPLSFGKTHDSPVDSIFWAPNF